MESVCEVNPTPNKDNCESQSPKNQGNISTISSKTIEFESIESQDYSGRCSKIITSHGMLKVALSTFLILLIISTSLSVFLVMKHVTKNHNPGANIFNSTQRPGHYWNFCSCCKNKSRTSCLSDCPCDCLPGCYEVNQYNTVDDIPPPKPEVLKSSYSMPTILSKPSNQEINKGDTIEIHCLVDKLGNLFIFHSQQINLYHLITENSYLLMMYAFIIILRHNSSVDSNFNFRWLHTHMEERQLYYFHWNFSIR